MSDNPDPPQRYVIGGWKRSVSATCCQCGDTTAFVVYSETPRDDTWCEAALAETMEANGWHYGGDSDENDLCERCSSCAVKVAWREPGV